MQPIEIWGGVECTVNRVGNTYYDQLEKNGHARRIEDIQLFADLGIRTMRYPVIWERIAPNGLEKANWSWTDNRLKKLQELNITPIAGLVHHGSGPKNTSLVDDLFPEKLAEFASAVAERYPWMEYYTPINEPLTTARFSGLYGFWYPHGTSNFSFAKALLIECKATVLSMRAIRKINPHAKLVQTDDLGKTYSTPKLNYQAEFENERRWLSFDILFGRLNKKHALWQFFIDIGITEEELNFFVENPCPPDIIGINHYITSERFLDHRIENYPVHTHGGNGKDQYADVEVVRVAHYEPSGHYQLLKETSERYPSTEIALTEVHLGCTRDEQLRWFKEAYDICIKLKKEGLKIRALTAWSLLGAYDWNTMLTRENNFYESGIFDVRTGVPRPTALAQFIKSLNEKKEIYQPIFHSLGWWRRPERLIYGMKPDSISVKNKSEGVIPKKENQPILITGGRGTLGTAFAKICDARGLTYHLLSRQDMDIADKASVEKKIAETKPWVIINAAGYVRVDDAEMQKELCWRENVTGPTTLAEVCNNSGIKLLTFSTDLVFDGNKKSPYLESHEAKPLNIYGLSKSDAEKNVLKNNSSALVIRTSSFFGPWDQYNFVTLALKQISQSQEFIASNEHVMSPTYVPDLVNTCLDLLIDNESGIWHLSNPSEISWARLAQIAAEQAGLNPDFVKPFPANKLGHIARRPLYSALSSERGILLPTLEDALGRYLKEVNFSEQSLKSA